MEREKPSLPFRIVLLGKHMDQLLEHRSSTWGLNRTQSVVLRILGRHPGLQAQDLCFPAGVEPASVSRTLQALERRGLVDRQPHPTDGRASIFSLTDAGQAAADAISQEMKELFETIMEGAGPQDLPAVERVLDTVWRNVRDQLVAIGVQPPCRLGQKPPTPDSPEPFAEAHLDRAQGDSESAGQPRPGQFHRHTER